MNKIQEGEIVALSGETRRMTADEVTESSAFCWWLGDDDEARSAWFLLSNLEVVE